MVPALELEEADAVHDEPAAAAVVQLITDDPTFHVELVVFGVTVNKSHVVDAPEYE